MFKKLQESSAEASCDTSMTVLVHLEEEWGKSSTMMTQADYILYPLMKSGFFHILFLKSEHDLIYVGRKNKVWHQ